MIVCHCHSVPASTRCQPATPPMRCAAVRHHDVWRIALIYPDGRHALMGRFATRADAVRHARLDGWDIS